MHFISFPFFIFFFILLLVYYTIPKQMQNLVLLSASFLFYCWADTRYLLYIILTGSSVFAAATVLGRVNEAKKAFFEREALQPPSTAQADSVLQKKLKKINRICKAVVCLTLLLNVGILAITKYTNFFISSFNRMSGSHLGFINLLVPMGISFYTFQAVAYLIDVYRGTISYEKSLVKFLLFTSFFPQQIQGPISRYGDLSMTLYAPHFFSWRHVFRGLERILWGLFKKLVIADRLRLFIENVFTISGDESLAASGTFSGTTVLAGLVFFVLMLYTDFSGGIDITIGVSESLGIIVTENFKQPFFSKSLKEYWRRWHITMGTWFRDYVFYPVSMSPGMRRLISWNKKHLGKTAARKVPVYIATFVTWFATGLWHGAGWNYVCWGLANAVILMLSEELEPLYEKMRKGTKISASRAFRIFQSVRTFLLICFLNLFDCAGSIGAATIAFTSIFVNANLCDLSNGTLLTMGLRLNDFIVIGVSAVILFVVDFYSYKAAANHEMPDIRNRIQRYPMPVVVLIYYVLFLVILIFGVYGPGYEQTQFIYNRF